jgi:hypothetical protein
MTAEQKMCLTIGFEALGPERVARGLTAHGHNWNDCFLALAVGGQPGALQRQLEGRWRKERVIGAMMGVRVQVVSEVVDAWDRDEGTFRALAVEWLEAGRAPAPAVPLVSVAW